MTSPTPMRGASSDKASRRLTVALCPSDTAYDSELAKLPHDIVLLESTHQQWNSATRPLPENIRVSYTLEDSGADILILGIDQWSFEEFERRLLFLNLRDRFRGPKIVVNHGCNMVDGCSAEIMRDLVGHNIMVSRTATAAKLWNVERSRVVVPGLTASEWPETDYSRGNVVVLQPWDHSQFYNAPATDNLVKRIDKKMNPLGRGRAFANFDVYRSLLCSSSIYFNPSYAAPAPQAMVEAQLCGLAIVTTDRHGESGYIVNGENGFASNDMDELYAHVRFLCAHPKEVQRIGANGRRTAQRIFGSERFLSEWDALLVEAVSGAKLSAIAAGAGE
jgi:hypothetical protein